MKFVFARLCLLLMSIVILISSHDNFAQNEDKGPKAFKQKDAFEYIVVINTSFGKMEAVLFEETPLHKQNFLALANEGFFDSTTFHRVISNFMIQGGDPYSKDEDPSNDGNGGPGYTIPAEIVDSITHKRGYLAAARLGDQVNPSKASSGSQFYIVQNQAGTPHLDGGYTVFGKLLSGFEVLDAIARAKVGRNHRPIEPIRMTIEIKKIKKKKLKANYPDADFLP